MTSNDPDQIRANIEQTRANLSDDVNTLTDEINPKTIIRRQTHRATGALGGLKDKVMGSAASAQDAAGDTLSSAGHTLTSAPAEARRQTQGSPLAAGLIAFGVGLVAAALIPTTQAEQQAAAAVKDRAEPAIDEAKAVAKESAENLKQPAQEAKQQVKDTAADAASTVKAEGQSATADVRDQAEQSRQAVTDH